MDQKMRRKRILLGMKGLRVLFECDDAEEAQKIIKLIDSITTNPDDKLAFDEIDRLVKEYVRNKR